MDEKTLVGVLASHDHAGINNDLARLMEDQYKKHEAVFKKFHFLMTGGTFDRIILGTKRNAENPDDRIVPISDDIRDLILSSGNITRLPSRTEGGVTILAFLVVQQICSIVWPFITPLTTHWLSAENLALMRLCDQWHVKRLMNIGSVSEWFEKEAKLDESRNLQRIPVGFEFASTSRSSNKAKRTITARKKRRAEYRLGTSDYGKRKKKAKVSPRDKTIALIAHDRMKERMVEFAVDHEQELCKFNRILSTGTTGREVLANTRKLEDRIVRYHSGPKGGDIEIATEILYGDCDVVVFFIDTLNPHPHIEDIRVVFGACMIQEQVRMLTNEMQAREYMQRVVRG